MKSRVWALCVVGIIVLTTAAFLLLPDLSGRRSVSIEGRAYSHIALLSDLHLPGNQRDAKTRVIENLNSWNDLNAVAVLGDTVQTRGTTAEYAYAKSFFSQLKAPVFAITGNHDFIYDDQLGPSGKNRKALPEQRREKLLRFRQLFSLEDHFYSKKLQGYLLVFLSADDLDSAYLASLSKGQLDWLKQTLTINRNLPTLIFFHAPLQNTYSGNGNNVGKQDFCAQPSVVIAEMLQANPQVFLWVSGHIHLAPSHRSNNSPENLYQGRVLNVHNPDLNGSSYLTSDDVQVSRHQGLATNSLFLYPDRVVIRMYDHNAQAWLPGERVIPAPKL
ncbi:hypothetical protein AXX12_06205 [Anaerosporomusa subterranea]|uniref:Calcineurin-like phosphoesterase domain-containing protein n=1 Tax=Anaerosporomusa subterranea TaxID=1794912 RepID=A0A154BQ13_ANASB|nr:metallophosphoesterase [Anaerosporomusa subterranea]KYZ76032.1 hypothetical protein AXX12_06205 [Anaerosporomusa subterranea]